MGRSRRYREDRFDRGGPSDREPYLSRDRHRRRRSRSWSEEEDDGMDRSYRRSTKSRRGLTLYEVEEPRRMERRRFRTEDDDSSFGRRTRNRPDGRRSDGRRRYTQTSYYNEDDDNDDDEDYDSEGSGTSNDQEWGYDALKKRNSDQRKKIDSRNAASSSNFRENERNQRQRDGQRGDGGREEHHRGHNKDTDSRSYSNNARSNNNNSNKYNENHANNFNNNENQNYTSVLSVSQQEDRKMKSSSDLIEMMDRRGILRQPAGSASSGDDNHRTASSETGNTSMTPQRFGVALCGVDLSVTPEHFYSIVEQLVGVKPECIRRPALDALRMSLKELADKQKALNEGAGVLSTFSAQPQQQQFQHSLPIYSSTRNEGVLSSWIPRQVTNSNGTSVCFPSKDLITQTVQSMSVNSMGGMVLLEFSDAEMASRASNLLDGSQLNGRRISASVLPVGIL